MPTYEYICTQCEHAFEQVQSFSDASLTICPICGGALRKFYGAVGVVFKGSGFYRTDSRKAESSSTSSAPSTPSPSTPSTAAPAPTSDAPAPAPKTATAPSSPTKPSTTSSTPA